MEIKLASSSLYRLFHHCTQRSCHHTQDHSYLFLILRYFVMLTLREVCGYSFVLSPSALICLCQCILDESLFLMGLLRGKKIAKSIDHL